MESFTDLPHGSRIYLAGPMRGLPEHNYPAFNSAATDLRTFNRFCVWNPAEDDIQPDANGKVDFRECMKRDLPQVCKADALIVLRGWQQSQGARLETNLAHELGIPIFDYETGERIKEIPPTGCFSKATTPNPKDLVGATKVSLSKFPMIALAHAALAMMDGAEKYGPYNWRAKDVQAHIYVDAALRHILDWFEGQECAPDSQTHHLGHAIACLAILLDAQELHCLIDDRPRNRVGAVDWFEKRLAELAKTRKEKCNKS